MEDGTLSLRVTLRYKDLDEFSARYSENISSAGVFIRTKTPKPAGTKIRFELTLSDGSAAIRGEGVVVTTRGDDRPGMALRFNHLDDASLALVERIVRERGDGSLAPTPLSAKFAARTPMYTPVWRPSKGGPAPWTPSGTGPPRRVALAPMPFAGDGESESESESECDSESATDSVPAKAPRAPSFSSGVPSPLDSREDLLSLEKLVVQESAATEFLTGFGLEAATEMVGADHPHPHPPTPSTTPTPMFSTQVRVTGFSAGSSNDPTRDPTAVLAPIGVLTNDAGPPINSGSPIDPPPIDAASVSILPGAAASDSATVLATFEDPEEAAPVRAPVRPIAFRPAIERSSSEVARLISGVESSSPIVGIDVGGRCVRIGVLRGGEFDFITAGGSAHMPALVAPGADGSLVALSKALELLGDDPGSTSGVAIRSLLRSFRGQDDLRIELKGWAFGLDEVLTTFFSALRQVAVARLGTDAFRSLIAIPADIAPPAQKLLSEACASAGLGIVTFLQEPLVMMRAYGLEDMPIVENVLTVDIGATHLGLGVGQRGKDGLRLVGSDWTDQISATDIDNTILDLVLRDLPADLNQDAISSTSTSTSEREGKRTRAHLLESIERARMEIQKTPVVDLKIAPHPEQLNDGAFAPRTISLPRGRLYHATEKIISDIILRIQALLRDAGIPPRSLNAIVVAGGAGGYPPLLQALASLTSVEPLHSIPPDQVVTVGLARAGREVTTDDIVMSAPPGVLAVAIGIGLPGGRYLPLLQAGAKLPARLTRKHATTRDKQTEVELSLYQGTAEQTQACRSLGTVTLTGVAKADRGVAQVDVLVEVDRDAVLTVVLRDETSNRTARLTVPTIQTSEDKRSDLENKMRARIPEREPSPPKKGFLSRLLGR